VGVITSVQTPLAPTFAAVGVATTFKLMENPAAPEPHVSTEHNFSNVYTF